MLRAVRIINRSLQRDQSKVTTTAGLQTNVKGKPIFGIDIGNHHSRLSVFDPLTKKPRLVRNIQDNTDYWHSVVAKNGSDFIVGKNALAKIRNDATSGVERVKSLLGQTSVMLQGDQFQPAELVAQIFKAMGESAAAYLHENNLAEPIEAYLSVPYSFTEQQREEFLHAAEIAGLKIVKLIEEPLAILNSTWRLEQNGQYLLADFGSNFRASVVRVFEGQFDILAHVEDVAVTETVEKALVEYVTEKLAKVKPLKYALKSQAAVHQQVLPYIRQINEDLISEPETSVIIDDVVVFVSREARALITHLPLRNLAATLGELMTKAGTVGTEMTHAVLVGGGSLQYPNSAEVLERHTSMATARTVAPPQSALAVGTALYGAREQGLLQPHFFRDRTVDRLGHIAAVSKRKGPQTYAEFENHLRSGTQLPLPTAITFNDAMAAAKVPPLNPEYDESMGAAETGGLQRKLIEDYRNPVMSLSFAKSPDPFTGTEEYFARVNVQAVADDFKIPLINLTIADKGLIFKKVTWMDPYERMNRQNNYARPMLKMHIVIDLSAPEYVSMAPDMPDFETWEEFIDKANIEDQFHMNRLLLGRDPRIEKHEKEGKVQLLKYFKEQLKKPYYRQLNRAHDAVQFILRQMEVHDIVAVSMRTADGLKNLVPFTRHEALEHFNLLNLILDTRPGTAADHASAAQFAFDSYDEADVEAFKEFRELLELRTVVLTDSVPDLAAVETVRKNVQEAQEKKCVNTSFISVSGRKFDSPIVKTIESVRGANYLELKNIFSEEFRHKYDKSHDAMLLNALLPRFYDVKVWVDFENYSVSKVYGFDYQSSPHFNTDEFKKDAVMSRASKASFSVNPEQNFHAQIEGKAPQLYVKTLFGSYHHDRKFAEELDLAQFDESARRRILNRKVTLEEDPRLFLFKLDKKPRVIERQSQWSYSPFNLIEDNRFSTVKKDVALAQSEYEDTRSQYTVRIQYADRSGTVKHFTRVHKLNEQFEYEEPGVRKSVLTARYVDLVRRVLHNKHVTLSGRAAVDVPAISAQNGISTLTRNQEKKLFDYYLSDPNLEINYYSAKSPQVTEADLPLLTKFSYYYNSEFNRLFNPFEQFQWMRNPLNYARDAEQLNLKFMKNMALQYDSRSIESDSKAELSYVRARRFETLPLKEFADTLLLKNYKPYLVPKFEAVMDELELHREWDRKEFEGSKTTLRLLRVINYLRWNTRALTYFMNGFFRKQWAENSVPRELGYRILLQSLEGKIWMRGKNYWGQLLTMQNKHNKRARTMESYIRKNDLVRVNKLLWKAKVDLDDIMVQIREATPEDQRDPTQLALLRREIDTFMFERMAEKDPSITYEAKNNLYEPDPKEKFPEIIDPVEIQRIRDDEEFGPLEKEVIEVKIAQLPEQEERLMKLARADFKRDVGKFALETNFAEVLTDKGLAKKKRQDILKRRREEEKKRKEREEVTGEQQPKK